MGAFILSNLEIIVAITCAGCIPLFYMAKMKSSSSNSNDVTKFIIKNKKINENINKQSKSLL